MGTIGGVKASNSVRGALYGDERRPSRSRQTSHSMRDKAKGDEVVTVGSSTVQERIRSLCAEVAAVVGAADRAEVRTIVEAMQAPVRVGVVGRVNSGKSTLVNALIGRRVAATAAQDCTAIVTEYRFGAPEHAVAVHRDGRRVTLGSVDPHRLDDQIDASTLSSLEVSLQSGLLTGMTLVDTPGLAGATGSFRWAEETRALVDADILVYLFRGAIRVDDTEVVREFTEATGGLRPTATNSIGLLSHADNFGSGGWGVDDPFDTAAASADRVARSLAGCFSAVIPVSGLMAETVRTGRLTENDARELRRLADADPTMLQFHGQLPSEPDSVDECLTHLSALLGPYGLNHGRAQASSAAALAEWLEQRSGMAAFQRHLETTSLPTVSQGRAQQAMSQLVSSAERFGRLASRLVEAANHGPELHAIREYRSYQLLLERCPDSHLVAPLADVVACGDSSSRPGLLGQLEATGGAPEALRRSSLFQAEASLARRGAEAEAARTLSISYMNLWTQLSGAQQPTFTAGGKT